MIRCRGLTLGNDSLVRRIDDTGLNACRCRELDRVVVDLDGGDVLGCVRVPRVGLSALHSGVQASVEVLNGVLGARGCDPLDAPANRSVVVRPSEFDVFGLRVLVVSGRSTIIRALSCALRISPHELLHGLAVQGDRALVRAYSGILKAGTCPPGALHVRLVLVGVRHFLDRTGQRRLVGDAFADDRPVVEHEGERRRPRERCAAVRWLSRDRE